MFTLLIVHGLSFGIFGLVDDMCSLVDSGHDFGIYVCTSYICDGGNCKVILNLCQAMFSKRFNYLGLMCVCYRCSNYTGEQLNFSLDLG